jgi:voltage-gated potassium channel
MKYTAFFLILRQMRLPLLVLIAAYAVAVLGMVLIPGVDTEGRPYRLDFFHAFYVISYTVTTIGFGELPYAFTAGQRLWVMFSIFLGVIAWLYAIGTLIALLQNAAFRQLISENRFTRSVQRLTESFYIVCGYGDTGRLLVRAITQHGLSAVVLDTDQDRINELSLENLTVYVPGLCADGSQPNSLILAGLEQPKCAGVVALTNNDAVNLKIAITTKLLNTRLKAICRAQYHDTKANMESFGTDAVINPFDTFADRLALALHSPEMYLVYEWLTEIPGEPLSLRINPPHGTWVLCGYGRFGKAVQRHLDYEGLPTVIVEKEPELTKAPKNTIIGRGTEAVTLREAHIEKAVGIVAGTDDDANNLSVIVTARDLNPNLFLVARQNDSANESIFRAAGLDLVMQRSRVVANRIFALIRTPLLNDFLRLARHKRNVWAKSLIERLWPITGNVSPDLWAVDVSDVGAPAVREALDQGRSIRLKHLIMDPRNRDDQLPCLPLLLKRAEEERLMPDENLELRLGDKILICGQPDAIERMRWVLKDRATLGYFETGETPPEGALFRWLLRRTD